METKIAIYIPDEEAKKFLIFQQYYDLFNLLLSQKVFEQKGATITLHFDKHGVLRSINRQDILYDYNSQFENLNKKVINS